MLETEQKIILSRDSLEKVFNELAPSNVKHKHHPRAYFDTLDMTLNKRKTALRIQSKKSGGYKQTIKAARDSDGASLVRAEWDMTITGKTPDFSVIENAEILDAVKGVDPAQMVHIFTSDVKRRFFDMAVDGGVVEIAFDLGRITLANGDISEEMCEIEVELKSGDPKIIDEVVKRILNMADDARISMVSKAERDFNLYQKHRL